MARPPRIWFPEALYHVIVRGNNREAIFLGDADRLAYLRMLRHASERYDCLVYAYVLMTNHTHLLVRTGATHGIARFMQSLNTGYCMYFNHRYGRVGHVLQGRYYSVLIGTDAQALEVVRYISLNPVRAGIVSHPQDHQWSSYHAYLRQRPEAEDVVECGWVLGLLTPLEALQRPVFRDFVLDGLQGQTSPLGRSDSNKAEV